LWGKFVSKTTNVIGGYSTREGEEPFIKRTLDAGSKGRENTTITQFTGKNIITGPHPTFEKRSPTKGTHRGRRRQKKGGGSTKT